MMPPPITDRQFSKAVPRLNHTVDIGISPRPAHHNFFKELGRSYHVATWTQMPCIGNGNKPSNACLSTDTFDAAYRSAPWALRKLLDETSGPIAIVAHSRGGLIARRLLKDFGDAGGRIKWLVTLHAPHAGTTIVGRPAAINDGISALLKVPPKSLSGHAISARDTLLSMSGTVGAEELAPHGAKSLFPALQAGERQVPGIAYLSYGGTSPNAIRFFVKAPGVGVKTFSLFHTPAFPEFKDGGGDMLVTDAIARLPWRGVPHVSQPLHHGEVLWNVPTMMSVGAFIKAAPRAASGSEAAR
jgi:pimeloyl-ACP methyl ester carboxylesterase